ncbi:trypsin-like serine protease [Jiangella muralis]|uniref:trypsin-like serine protease n=1 Tax=Jiangella muralis TaxID=702383 RepID=UPI0012F8B4AB|nr:trypsin-like serine protease [Jiangella muralis]
MAGNSELRVRRLRGWGAAIVASAVVWAGAAAPAPAVTGGAAADAAGPVVRIEVGDQNACSGVLVAPQWVLTVASCFPADGGAEVRTGAAPEGTTATVGRTGPSTADGYVRAVDWVVPHPDQDVALARLALSVDTTPLPVAGTPASDGEALAISGYGRTVDTWTPAAVHTAGVTASAVTAASFVLSAPAESSAGACGGDAGAPVTRTVDGAAQLVGVLVGSARDGCLVPAGAGERTATALRVDTLAAWIGRNTVWFNERFSASYVAADGDGDGRLDGIAGYDLASTSDQMIAVDYEGTGRLDHLLIYRPGAEKKYWVVKRRADGTFERVFQNRDAGIGPVPAGGTVLLGDARDRVFAFDCHRSGKQDCIVVYRPGLVSTDSESASYSVFERNPSGGYQRIFRHKLGRLSTTADQMMAVDDDTSRTGQHLVFYRPGAGWVTVVSWAFDVATYKWGLGPNVYVTEGEGIGGFDVGQARDRMIAFDCHRSGRQDCLVGYRPGVVAADPESSSYRVIERVTGGTYRTVYRHPLGRLNSTADQLIAYDYDGSGHLDDLLFYRPGAGWVTVLPGRRGAGGGWESGPAVYSNQGGGIAGYNMAHAQDRLIAYDNDHRGSPTDLVAYRPGSRIAWVLGRRNESGDAPVTVTRPAGDDSIVERLDYPVDFQHRFTGSSGWDDWGTDEAEALNFELISGNGGIIWVSCSEGTEAGVGVLRVFVGRLNGETIVGEPFGPWMAVCFKVLEPDGFVKLTVPGVYEITGDGGAPGKGNAVDATVTDVTSGVERTELVEPDDTVQFGISDDSCDWGHPDFPDNCREDLLELRVVG